jgi:hypothetical protein
MLGTLEGSLDIGHTDVEDRMAFIGGAATDAPTNPRPVVAG